MGMFGCMIENTKKLPFTPYHIKSFDPTEWINGHTDNYPMYIQKKYDGTHVVLSMKYGAHSHNGDIVNSQAMKGLLWLWNNDPDFQELVDFLSKNQETVVVIELFGSEITPRNYHKEWNTPYDFRVLDMWVYGRFVEPIFIKDYVPKTAHTEVIDYHVDENELLKIMKDFANREDWYEGAVIKQYGHVFRADHYYVGNGLRIAKFKPKEYANVPQKFAHNKELFDEVINELEKHNGKATVDEIIMYLKDAHPELVGKKEEKTRAIVGQIIKWYRYVRK